MRVFHVINDICPAHGGAQQVVRHLHEGLLAREHDSHIITTRTIDAPLVRNQYCLGLKSLYDARAITRFAAMIRRECRPGDILHAHLFPAMLHVSLAARLAGWPGPLLCTEHSTRNRRRGTLWGRLIDHVLYSRYDRIACISNATQQALLTWMPKLAPRLSVVRNGARLVFDEYTARPDRETTVILSVGRLDRPKNYNMSLRALALLNNTGVEYRIAGQGPELAVLQQLTHELGLEGHVQFLGFIEALPEQLRKADIFLMPSRWEGFGLAAVEAMNAGLPIVAGDVAGLREIVGSDESCGVLVDPCDPRSIAEGVCALLRDPAKRKRMGMQGIVRAQAFSEEAMIDNYLALYDSMLNPDGNHESLSSRKPGHFAA